MELDRKIDLKLRRHPGKQALVAYAENLVDNRQGIDRALAAHLSQCPACNAEIKAIQASLAFTASAPALEPGTDLTARILLSGKQERAALQRKTTPLRTAWKIVQGGACAAAIFLVAGVTFSAFLDADEPDTARPVFERPVPVIAADATSPEALRKAAAEVAAEGQALTAAIQSRQGDSLTPREMEQLRVVQARGDDIAAAVSALERNPHNVRATHVVHATLKSLRDLYVEGGGSL